MTDASKGSRARTGIEFLDAHLHGGFPRPSSLLFFSELPSERRTFAERFVVEGAREGETCLYIDFFRAPQLARREFEQHGAFPRDRVLFVDAISSQLMLPSDEIYQIRRIEDLKHIGSVIEGAISDCHPSRIVVDSMEFLADRFPKTQVFENWQRFVRIAKKTGSVICFLFLNWNYGDQDLEEIRTMTDFILEFRTTMEKVRLKNRLRVIQVRDKRIESNWIPYAQGDITGTDEIAARVLITGPSGSGKTSVVEKLSGKTLVVERAGTSVSFDYRRINVMSIDPEERFPAEPSTKGFTFQVFAEEVRGILLVIDSTRPNELREAQKVLEFVRGRIQCVILLNKSDLPGAMSTEDVAKRLGIGPDVPIVRTVATEGRGVLDALRLLGERIIEVS